MRSSPNVVGLFFLTLFFSLPQDTIPTAHVITLGVYDRAGQSVGNIKANQIRIKSNAATVRRVEVDNGPRRIILLLDTSGSMGHYKTRSWRNVTQMAIQFVSLREGTDLIALHAFSDEHEVLVPFTRDSQLVIQQIQSITRSGLGTTMLGQALAEILASKPGGLRFGDGIVLISDGEYSKADSIDFGKLRFEFIRAGLRVCLLRVRGLGGSGRDPTVRDAADFVVETGGVELSTPVPRAPRAAYDFVRTFYRAELEVLEPIQKPHKFTVELLDQQGRKMKKVELTYPRYLLPNPAQP